MRGKRGRPPPPRHLDGASRLYQLVAAATAARQADHHAIRSRGRNREALGGLCVQGVFGSCDQIETDCSTTLIRNIDPPVKRRAGRGV